MTEAKSIALRTAGAAAPPLAAAAAALAFFSFFFLAFCAASLRFVPELAELAAEELLADADLGEAAGATFAACE